MSFSFPYKPRKKDFQGNQPPIDVILDGRSLLRSWRKIGIILPSWPCVWPRACLTYVFQFRATWQDHKFIWMCAWHIPGRISLLRFLITAITYSPREMSSAFKGKYRGPWLCSASFQVRGLLDNVDSNQRRLHGCRCRTEEPLHVSEFSAHRQGEDGR